MAKFVKVDKVGFIDKNGTEVVPCIYDDAVLYPQEGLIRVEKDGKFGFIDKNGKQILPIIYDYKDLYDEDFPLDYM